RAAVPPARLPARRGATRPAAETTAGAPRDAARRPALGAWCTALGTARNASFSATRHAALRPARCATGRSAGPTPFRAAVPAAHWNATRTTFGSAVRATTGSAQAAAGRRHVVAVGAAAGSARSAPLRSTGRTTLGADRAPHAGVPIEPVPRPAAPRVAVPVLGNHRSTRSGGRHRNLDGPWPIC